MAEERSKRRLAAILAADVAGYSRLMQVDEAGTLAALKARRKDILQPIVAEHDGRIVKLMGDGVLIEFASAVDAVECAARLQEAMSAANAGVPADRQIVLRIGVNLGDVMVEGSDLYGDGVNIAARLEAMAEPGGVCVSQTVYGHVRGKVQFGFDDLGEQNLKNMAEPVRVYRISGSATPGNESPPAGAGRRSKHSIAVLPFANMSGDPEQEYFSDGITEDIITDLSKVSALEVVSRNTVFTFKGKAVEIGRVAKQLNVGHVVEGSVRKAGRRVRITAQLIDASKDSHVWAERYDRDLNDIFALQDEISQAIASALKIKLLPEEKKAIESRSTHDPEAYRNYLEGRYYHDLRTGRSLEVALRFCQKSVEIDPNYARAWALIALCQADIHFRGKSVESGLDAAEKALSLDSTLADAHAAKGRVLAELGRLDEALAAHEASLRLDPDSFDVQYYYGRTCATLGRHEEAVKHYDRAAKLSETDFTALGLACQSYESFGRLDEATSRIHEVFARIEKAIARNPANSDAVVAGAVVLAYLGDKERAKEWASRALILEPEDAVGHYNVACALARLGEPEQAMDLLEACHKKMPPESILWTKNDSDLASLHDHPRYQALIAQGEAKLAAAKAKTVEPAVAD